MCVCVLYYGGHHDSDRMAVLVWYSRLEIIVFVNTTNLCILCQIKMSFLCNIQTHSRLLDNTIDDLVQPFQPGPIRRKLHHASRLRKRQIKRAAFRTYGIKQIACRLTHPHAASARRICTPHPRLWHPSFVCNKADKIVMEALDKLSPKLLFSNIYPGPHAIICCWNSLTTVRCKTIVDHRTF